MRGLRLWTRPDLAVEDRLFRALALLRALVLVNSIGLNIYNADNFTRPVAGIACVVVMVAWTCVATWAYADPARRTPTVLVADLALATALILASPWVKGEEMRATVPGFWVSAALLAWAVHWNWRGGLFAAALLAAADLSVRIEVSQANYGNVFLLLIGGAIVGFLSESLQRMESERDAAQREVIVAEERARLARAVHDGVLQVLSLVQRRGSELAGASPALGELSRLAGEQETALRSLIRQQDVAPTTPDRADLSVALEQLATVAPVPVTVAAPGRPVELPAYTVAELTAAVRACLDNVAAHVGPESPAWVLLDDHGDRVVVTVRDEGPGIAADRLAQAAAEGRLGVSQSIRGRLSDLGGTATVETGGFGTEWELAVPR